MTAAQARIRPVQSENTPSSPRPRWRAMLPLAAVAVLLHALVLASVATVGSPLPSPSSPSARALQVRVVPSPVRTVAAASPAAESTAPTASTPPTRPTPTAPSVQPTAPPPAQPTVLTLPPAAAGPLRPDAAEPAAVDAPAIAAEQPVTVAAASLPTPAMATDHAAPPANGDTEIPLYKTRIPPPLTLHYDLHRGLLSGSATLTWRPAGERYEARLEGRVAGFNVLTQTSQGSFDEAGIAPHRFTDQRMGREVRAANFQHDKGRITFSGPSAEFALLMGTQDRLSWMLQLAAVVSAEPRRLQPGGKVALYVVGARADAAMWIFRCLGEEIVNTPGGTVHAVKFTREAQGPYDTQADAWLDPARHGLPVRARLGTGSDGEVLELLLRQLQID